MESISMLKYNIAPLILWEIANWFFVGGALNCHLEISKFKTSGAYMLQLQVRSLAMAMASRLQSPVQRSDKNRPLTNLKVRGESFNCSCRRSFSRFFNFLSCRPSTIFFSTVEKTFFWNTWFWGVMFSLGFGDWVIGGCYIFPAFQQGDGSLGDPS